jgi:hypothetical protein
VNPATSAGSCAGGAQPDRRRSAEANGLTGAPADASVGSSASIARCSARSSEPGSKRSRGHSLPGRRHQLLEDGTVDVVVADQQRVSAPPGDQHCGTVRPERPPQTHGMAADPAGRGSRRPVRPDLRHEPVDADRAAGLGDKNGKHQPTLARPIDDQTSPFHTINGPSNRTARDTFPV